MFSGLLVPLRAFPSILSLARYRPVAVGRRRLGRSIRCPGMPGFSCDLAHTLAGSASSLLASRSDSAVAGGRCTRKSPAGDVRRCPFRVLPGDPLSTPSGLRECTSGRQKRRSEAVIIPLSKLLSSQVRGVCDLRHVVAAGPRSGHLYRPDLRILRPSTLSSANVRSQRVGSVCRCLPRFRLSPRQRSGNATSARDATTHRESHASDNARKMSERNRGCAGKAVG